MSDPAGTLRTTRLVTLTEDRSEGIFVSAEYMEGVSVTAGGVQIPYGDYVRDDPGGIFVEVPVYDFDTSPASRAAPASVDDLLAGVRGGVNLRYRLYASDKNGGRLYEILDYSGALVDLSNYRDHTWEISFGYLPRESQRSSGTDSGPPFEWIKAEAELYDPGAGETHSFALGLYRVSEVEDSSTREVTVYSVTARSAEDTLLDDNAHLGYSVLPGEGVLARSRDILLSRGFEPDRVRLPPLGSDRTLATGMYFDPISDHSGTYWLRIINALLNAGGFYALYTDSEGRFTTHKVSDRQDRTPNVLYSSEARSDLGEEYGLRPQLLVHGELSGSYETEGFENRVVVMSTDVNTIPPIYVIVENRDPNSPNSIQNRGIRTGEPIALSNIATREDAEAIGRAEIAKKSGRDRKVTLRTMHDPRRTARETYLLDMRLESGETVARGLYYVTGTRLPLDTNGEAVMEHELSTVEHEGTVVP